MHHIFSQHVLEKLVLFITLETVVGLEQSLIQVSEDVGMVEVCAIVYSAIDCPTEVPFDVKLATRNGSAGEEKK